jgi:plastocyanin
MSRKKKRRGAQQKKEETPPPSATAGDGGGAEDDTDRTQRRAEQIRDWEARKRQRERGQRSLAPYFWTGGVAVVVALAALGGVLLLSGGDDSVPAAPSATQDARVAGLPIDVTLTVEADDDGQNVDPRYIPPQITAQAGQVVEIVMPNAGSVVHNLRVAGLDGEYTTDDDWITDPLSVQAGDEGRVVLKIDEAGTYPFKCDFHPTQVGALILS